MLQQERRKLPLAVNVGETLVPSLVEVRQPSVIQANQAQDCRIHVMHVDGVLHRPADRTRRWNPARVRLDSGARHPHAERIGMVVAAIAPLGQRRAAELAAPNDQR